MPDVARTFPNLTNLGRRDDNVIRSGGNVIPMGTIRERPRKDGSVGYTAQIILKRKGEKPHREARTFSRRGAAAAWMKNREAELAQPGGLAAARNKGLTLADTIDRYVDQSLKEIGRTKASVLKAIKGYDIGRLEAARVGSPDIVAFAQQLAATGMKPQTVQNYLSHLSAVFAIARGAWGIDLDREAMRDAFAAAKRLGLTAKSEKRDRRPTIAEMDKLMEFFGERQTRAPDVAPMQRIIGFALFSTRRLGEIVRIEWADYDPGGKRILVRDMKHPGQKAGNDIWCDLPDEAVGFMGGGDQTGRNSPQSPAIAGAKGGAQRIFPYTEDAIGAAFTRACYALGINTEGMPDDERLHFHDLRHEGVSRLFEMGKTIPQAASVSGHRSWQSLQRYSHMRQTGDKWAGWKWLPLA